MAADAQTAIDTKTSRLLRENCMEDNPFADLEEDEDELEENKSVLCDGRFFVRISMTVMYQS